MEQDNLDTDDMEKAPEDEDEEDNKVKKKKAKILKEK